MNLIPPKLTSADVAQALVDLHRRKHRVLTTVFFAEAANAQMPEVEVELPDGSGLRFRVVEAACELDLRDAIEGGDAGGPAVILARHSPELPRDLQALVASGRVLFVEDKHRVLRRFGREVRELSAALIRSPLFRALAHDTPGQTYTEVRGRTLTLDHAWAAWLEVHAALHARGGLRLDLIMEWVATTQRSEALAARLRLTPGLEDALDAWLTARFGPIAAIAARTWRLGCGEAFAVLGIIVESVERPPSKTGDGALGVWLSMALHELRLRPTDLEALADDAVWSAWGQGSRGLLQRQATGASVGRLLQRADARLGSHGAQLAGALERSRYLRFSWAAQAQALNALLVQLAASTITPDIRLHLWREARQRWLQLGQHRQAEPDAQSRSTYDAGLLALRLARWLGEELPQGNGGDPLAQQCGFLARAYVEQGAWADQLRRRLRVVTAAELREGIERLLQSADARAELFNDAFVTALQGWQRRGRPLAGTIVPIERLLAEVADAILAPAPHRRLAVVVLDGLSWGKATELLESIAREGWGPAAIAATTASEPGRAMPVLAALPTGTEISRAALFRGSLLPSGQEEATSKDVQRFAAHEVLRQFADVGGAPRLLLGGEAVDRRGKLAVGAQALLKSDDRVVGLVLNAADDQLHGSAHLSVRYALDTMAAVADVLHACRVARRAVLLCADHGHVLDHGASVRTDLSHDRAKQRWRPLGPAFAAAGDGELALRAADAAWCPSDADGIALLTREGDRHHGARSEGTHGGANVQEVLTPAVLLGHDAIAQDADGEPDEALRPVEPRRPAWWDVHSDVQAPPAPLVRPARDGPRPQRPRPAQLQLGQPTDAGMSTGPASSSHSTPAAQPARPATATRLDKAIAFAVTLIANRDPAFGDRAQALLTALAGSGGQMSSARAATATGIMQGRVAGLVSTLSERLNVDGMAVLALSPTDQTVSLRLDLLEQLFAPEDGK